MGRCLVGINQYTRDTCVHDPLVSSSRCAHSCQSLITPTEQPVSRRHVAVNLDQSYNLVSWEVIDDDVFKCLLITLHTTSISEQFLLWGIFSFGNRQPRSHWEGKTQRFNDWHNSLILTASKFLSDVSVVLYCYLEIDASYLDFSSFTHPLLLKFTCK